MLVASEAADTESNTFSTNNVGLRPGTAVPLSIIGYIILLNNTHMRLSSQSGRWLRRGAQLTLNYGGGADRHARTHTRRRARTSQVLLAGWRPSITGPTLLRSHFPRSDTTPPPASSSTRCQSLSLSLSRPTRTSDLALAHALHRCAAHYSLSALLLCCYQCCCSSVKFNRRPRSQRAHNCIS